MINLQDAYRGEHQCKLLRGWGFCKDSRRCQTYKDGRSWQALCSDGRIGAEVRVGCSKQSGYPLGQLCWSACQCVCFMPNWQWELITALQQYLQALYSERCLPPTNKVMVQTGPYMEGFGNLNQEATRQFLRLALSMLQIMSAHCGNLSSIPGS